MVALHPLLHIAVIQILVSQNQRAEALACIFLFKLDVLMQLKNRDLFLNLHFILFSFFTKTHIEVSGGDVLQFVTGGVQPLIDDGVRPLAV